MCECWHCKELCPALNWAKANMPKEHFDAFAELYDKWTHAEMKLASEDWKEQEGNNGNS